MVTGQLLTRDDSLVFWTRVVWSDPRMSGPNRFLLLALAYLANPAGNVTVTQGAIAALMNVGVKTIRAAQKRCERNGWIEVQPGPDRRRGAREGLTYQLLAPIKRT